MSELPLRVFMVDDEALILEGLKMILEFDDRFEVVGTASGAEEAIAAVEGGLQADVIVTDLRMQGLDGIDLTRLLKQTIPATPVLLLSSSDESLHAHDALRAGASGYLMKRSAPDELGDALVHIASGGMHLSGEMWARLSPARELPSVTDDHERELMNVLKQVPAPSSYRASQLHWPLPTYEARLYALLETMGVHEALEVSLALHRPTATAVG